MMMVTFFVTKIYDGHTLGMDNPIFNERRI